MGKISVTSVPKKVYLLIILGIGTFLRLFELARMSVLGDEPLYIYRAMGWIDHLASDLQTTPVDWFRQMPSWAYLSFHDHPPLTFFINFLFYQLSDAGNLFFARLPAAIFGVLSIILVFLIARKLYTERIALIAAVIFSLNSFAVFFGRVALMESITLSFILLTVLYFLRACNKPKEFLLVGLFFGCAFLSKYVVIFFVPVIIGYLVLFRRDVFHSKVFYLGLLVTLVVISPVLIYNIALFQKTHHFDLQIASLLHQATPEWQMLVGKMERHDLGYRIRHLLDVQYYVSPIFLAFLGMSFGWIMYLIYQNPKSFRAHYIVLASLAAVLLLILEVGPAARFLFYFIPFFCILIALIVDTLVASQKRLIWAFLAFCALFEIGFTLNTSHYPEPYLQNKFLYATGLRKKDDASGNLDNYLQRRLSGLKSAVTLTAKNDHMNRVMQTVAAKKQGTPANLQIILDPHIDISPMIWIYWRRMLYEGWPVISLQRFTDTVHSGQDITYLYIASTPIAARNKTESFPGKSPETFEQELIQKNIIPDSILTHAGDVAFRVYTFQGDLYKK